jgi:hypothetical protein
VKPTVPLAPIWPSPTREAEEAREARLRFLQEYVVPEAEPLPDAPMLDWSYTAPPRPAAEPSVLDLLPPKPSEPLSPFAPPVKLPKPEERAPAPEAPPQPKPQPKPKPPASEFKIVVRLPSGKRIDRVFKRGQSGQDVFAWVSSQAGTELKKDGAALPYSLSAGPAKLRKDQSLEAQGIGGPMLMTVFID